MSTDMNEWRAGATEPARSGPTPAVEVRVELADGGERVRLVAASTGQAWISAAETVALEDAR